MDFYYLESQKKFKRKKLGDEWYSYDFGNVSFKYSLLLNEQDERIFPEKGKRPYKEIESNVFREHLYLNGFILNGDRHVSFVNGTKEIGSNAKREALTDNLLTVDRIEFKDKKEKQCKSRHVPAEGIGSPAVHRDLRGLHSHLRPVSVLSGE